MEAVILELLHNAGVVVYDSTHADGEYPSRVGWVHSTWQECLRLAEAVGFGRAGIVHHDPDRTDAALDAMAAEAEGMRHSSLVAREGMELVLWDRHASHQLNMQQSDLPIKSACACSMRHRLLCHTGLL